MGTVDLPKKHGRGGQSALRFARLRMEKRHNYVRKVAEVAVQLFISNDKPNCSGLILAGSADFKTELSQSDMFDSRLQAKIIKLVDISYGGENGFNQAIELAAESLANVKFIQEKKLIGRYFDEISQDTGKYCFGVDDTLKALEMGAVETLICWENLDIQRVTLKNHASGEERFYSSTQSRRKTRPSTPTRRLVWRWSWRRTCHCWSGWPTTIRSSEPALRSSLIVARREANMSEDSVVLVECSATLLTFSRCNATTWMTRTTTWTTIKLSKSSLQLKLFHHNMHLRSTYTLVLDMTTLFGLAVLCLGLF